MPCATTPAPTDDGRAKPRSTRGRTPRDADARWLEGGRQFAPWHYTVEAMLQDAKGVLHNPPPEVKELGNGWHWGGFSAPGPSRHGHLGQAGGFWYIARTASAPGHHPVMGEGLDEESHWAAAAQMQHTLVGWPTLEPAVEVILEWKTPRCVGYPAADDLRQDVDTGFDMLGQVRSAPGWRRRSDEPEGLDRLRRENPTYVARKAATPRDQEHTRALLDELVAETRLGRVTGPCAAPDHWSVSTVALPSVADMVLRQPPSGDCFAALSFAICQVDENGELAPVGPQRHPATSDVPTHHFLGDIVDLVLRAWAEGWDPVVFGHDLLGGGRDALVPLRHVLRRRGERVEL
ncbi:hypothetical protein AK812_SmicGene17728 [Symbiodinium microadriaticum]|uniref:Uncharacterized protein n=1 Tax=Symbiodinium microadriaticum TaxID=2951 RepID=A0A1Q9DX00_SYMMI|nr:hypothetical protein AK812_SmicGene17728 [Symbiodinium microadriaticum]